MLPDLVVHCDFHHGASVLEGVDPQSSTPAAFGERLGEKLRGNWATLNPGDAARIGVGEGERIRVESRVGELEIEARLSPEIREGVIAIHQFFGHQYDAGTRASRRHPGVNVNRLHDDRVRDRFSGMPVFNGTPCRVRPLQGRGE